MFGQVHLPGGKFTSNVPKIPGPLVLRELLKREQRLQRLPSHDDDDTIPTNLLASQSYSLTYLGNPYPLTPPPPKTYISQDGSMR